MIRPLYNRSLTNIKFQPTEDKKSTKEKAFDMVLEGAAEFFKHNRNKTGKDFVNMCLDLHNQKIPPNQEEDTKNIIYQLGKNESNFFGTQTFPRGFQKTLAIGYIHDNDSKAFINGKFNFIGFKQWISKDSKSKYAANYLKSEYFEHITLDKDSNIKFGNTEYKNQFDLRNFVKLTSVGQIEFISDKLNEPANKYFKKLIDIPTIGNVVNTSPVVSGDLDGSHARLVLLAIKTGKMSLTREGLKSLIAILNEEATLMKNLNTRNNNSNINMKGYQGNREHQKHLNNVINHATFISNDTPLIFIGDCIHDRFCLNKRLEMGLRDKLKSCNKDSVIFIKGNHDSYDELEKVMDIVKTHQIVASIARMQGIMETFGQYAQGSEYTKENKERFLDHEKKVFQNAYYHEASNTLYLHNGFNQVSDTKIKTVFGMIEANNVSDFVEQMNSKTYIELGSSNMTDFRPATASKTIGFLSGIRVVHGHNDIYNITRDKINTLPVININSRTNQGYDAVAVKIGDSVKPEIKMAISG